jgi:hypothetical protein
MTLHVGDTPPEIGRECTGLRFCYLESIHRVQEGYQQTYSRSLESSTNNRRVLLAAGGVHNM